MMLQLPYDLAISMLISFLQVQNADELSYSSYMSDSVELLVA